LLIQLELKRPNAVLTIERKEAGIDHVTQSKITHRKP